MTDLLIATLKNAGQNRVTQKFIVEKNVPKMSF